MREIAMEVDTMIHVALGRRVREIRQELYGESDGPTLAEALGLLAETWANYERGVIIPASVILGFIELTGTDPHWLLTGQGECYTTRRAATRAIDLEERRDRAAGS
jgi:hypothetical protein